MTNDKIFIDLLNKALSFGYHAAKDEAKGIGSNGYGGRFMEIHKDDIELVKTAFEIVEDAAKPSGDLLQTLSMIKAQKLIHGINKTEAPDSNVSPQFTYFAKRDNFVQGVFKGYSFDAALYENGSVSGINKGCVSKLNIYDENDDTLLVHYDRSWDKKPKKEFEEIYNTILDFLENAPKTLFVM